MEVNQALTLGFACFTETAMLHHAFTTFLERNDVKAKYYWLALLLYAFCVLFTAGNSFSIYFVSLFCYSLIVLFSLIFFRNQMEVKLIVSFMFVALNYAFTVLAATFLWQMRGNPISEYPWNLEPAFWSQAILYLLFTVSVFVIDKLRNYEKDKNLLFDGIYVFCVPLFMLLIILKLFYVAMQVQSREYMLENFLIISGLLLLLGLSLYFLADRTRSISETMEQKQIIEQLLSMQDVYYKELESQQKEIRSISHDMKSHLRYLNTILAQGQTERAQEYVKTIYQDVESAHSVVHCGNSVIDAILSNKLQGAEDFGIRLEFDLIIPPQLSVRDIDILILLGNLLDNAMEACKRLEIEDGEKFIYVNARVQKGFLCIQVNNSYNGLLNLVENSYATVKTEKHFCGIGLSNIKRIVNKYHGKLNITHTETVFSVLALLALDE